MTRLLSSSTGQSFAPANAAARTLAACLVPSLMLCGVAAQVVPISGTVSGTINGTPVAIAITGTANAGTGRVVADYGNVPPSLGPSLAKMTCFITNCCRSYAVQSGGALNLLAVTGGNFQRTAMVGFPTGEVLNMTHAVTVGPGGMASIVAVSGAMPTEALGDAVTIDDFSELWHQAGPGALKAQSPRTYRVNGVTRHYTWTFGVTYSGAAVLPFPELARSTSNLATFDPVTNSVHQESTNTVEPSPLCFSPAESGVQVVTGDDVVDAVHRPLGFSFPMAGSGGSGAWTHLRVSTNGWAMLTNGTSAPGLPSATNYGSLAALQGSVGSGPILAPYWGDANFTAGNAGGVHLDVTSNPGVSATVTWLRGVDFNATGVKSWQMELFVSGAVTYRYSSGFQAQGSATRFVGVSCGNGAVPTLADFVPGPSVSSTGSICQPFPTNTWDMNSTVIGFAPSGGGWTESVSCSQAPASNTAYGSGCYSISDSFYEPFPDASFAVALTGQSMVLTPSAGGYVASWGGGTYVPPSGGATNVFATPTDDGEAVIALSSPFPTPAGPVSSVRVHSNGLVSWGSVPQTFPGTNSYTPTAAAFLAAGNGGIWSWHDYNESEVGSGRIKYEEVSGVVCITWDGVENYSSPQAANPGTMQIQLNCIGGNTVVIWPVIDPISTSAFGSAHLVGYSPAGPSVDPGGISLAASLPLQTGTVNVPSLSLSAAPVPVSTLGSGTVVSYTTSNMPEHAPGVYLGLLVLSLGQLPGGLDLGVIGAPGCRAYVQSIDVTMPLVDPASSQAAAFTLPPGIPYGAQFYAQSVALFPPGSLPNGQNALGMVSSNGIQSFVSNN